MAGRNEEQLLSELLREVGTSDNHVDAADLEGRVLAAWDQVRPTAAAKAAMNGRGLMRRRKPSTMYWKVFSGVAAVMLIAMAWPMSQSNPPNALPAVRPPVRLNSTLTSVAPFDVQAFVGRPPVAPSRIARLPIARSPIPEAPIEFVPLIPMSERELAGSFQIVRVQMPRASLGALTSPFEQPSELVEADVLLGEDGLARAIRLSTDESIYSGRSR